MGSGSLRGALAAALLVMLTACGGGGDGSSILGGSAGDGASTGGTPGGGSSGGTSPPPPTTAAPLTVSGSIGDGPIVGADVKVFDRNGREIAATVSTDLANYSVQVPADASFPLRVVASGGTDLVSTRGPQFDLVSVIASASQTRTHVSPITTLIVRTAQCRGGLQTEHLEAARDAVAAQLGAGYDAATFGDPLTTVIGGTNVAAIVKSNQVLAEIVNRSATLARERGMDIASAAVLDAFACDLVDGALDADGGTAIQQDVVALAQPVLAQVLTEAATNRLEVDGLPATTRLDAAIRRIQPTAPASAVVEAVPIVPELVRELRTALAANAAAESDAAAGLVDLAIELESVRDARTPEAMRQLLGDADLERVDVLVDSARERDADDLAAVRRTLAATPPPSSDATQPAPAPTLELTAGAESVMSGSTARLRYTATNASLCIGSAGIRGALPSTAGEIVTPPVTGTTTFSITCVGDGGSISRSVTLTTTGVSLRFVADRASVEVGGRVELMWESARADQCEASGGWTGARATNGRVVIDGVRANTRFTLRCSAGEGFAEQTVDVAIAAPQLEMSATGAAVDLGASVTVRWTATNANACTASGAWSGPRASTGSETVRIFDATELVLECTGPSGRVRRSVAMGVLPPTLALSVDRASVDLGATPTLTWNSTNATRCVASGSWSGERPVSGSALQAALTQAAEYSLVCSGPGGSATRSVAARINAPVLEFTADRTVIEAGQSVTLRWTARNASGCTASGGWNGARPSSGTAVISGIDAPMTFTLACAGGGTSTAPQSLRVVVRPSVTLTTNLQATTPGATVNLNWSSSGATSCVASGDDPAFRGPMPASGSRTSSPINGNWSFVLACSNAAGEAVATATVVTNGVRVSWTPPTSATDGQQLSGTQGFNVYYGRAPRRYDGVIYVAGANATSGVVPIGAGTWYLAVTAVAPVQTASGPQVRESDYSPELRKVVQ